jgi:hypothetical protein
MDEAQKVHEIFFKSLKIRAGAAPDVPGPSAA